MAAEAKPPSAAANCDLTVIPVQRYWTLGEVAMIDGQVVMTAKQGILQVERQGLTEQVAEGKTVLFSVKTAQAPVPNPPVPPASNGHFSTATMLAMLGLGAGATVVANVAGALANATGCALNVENARENPGIQSPHTPPSGYSCQDLKG